MSGTSLPPARGRDGAGWPPGREATSAVGSLPISEERQSRGGHPARPFGLRPACAPSALRRLPLAVLTRCPARLDGTQAGQQRGPRAGGREVPGPERCIAQAEFRPARCGQASQGSPKATPWGSDFRRNAFGPLTRAPLKPLSEPWRRSSARRVRAGVGLYGKRTQHRRRAAPGLPSGGSVPHRLLRCTPLKGNHPPAPVRLAFGTAQIPLRVALGVLG